MGYVFTKPRRQRAPKSAIGLLATQLLYNQPSSRTSTVKISSSYSCDDYIATQLSTIKVGVMTELPRVIALLFILR